MAGAEQQHGKNRKTCSGNYGPPPQFLSVIIDLDQASAQHALVVKHQGACAEKFFPKSSPLAFEW